MKELLKNGQVFKFPLKLAKYDFLCGKVVGQDANAHVDFTNLTFQNGHIVEYHWTEHKEDGWERRRIESFDVQADSNLLSQCWKVTETSFSGSSGSAMGHSAGYPDGHHVTAQTLDGSVTVTFFQSGSFIGMQRPENIELVMTGDTISVQELLTYSDDKYWANIESEVRAAGIQARGAHLLNHQAAHLLEWANIARNAAKSKDK